PSPQPPGPGAAGRNRRPRRVAGRHGRRGEQKPMSTAATPHEGRPTGGPAPAVGFQQRLGLFDATMLVAGTMIGSGIFVVSADVARDVGSSGWLLLVWGLTGLITVMGALSYGGLAAMMPHAGGQHVSLRGAYS